MIKTHKKIATESDFTKMVFYFKKFYLSGILLKFFLLKKGGTKVQILGQGGAVKRPPMDEMT